MTKNIGKIDRIVRLILGILLFLSISVVDNQIAQWFLFVLSLACLFQAIVGWCGLYALLGKNTCPVK